MMAINLSFDPSLFALDRTCENMLKTLNASDIKVSVVPHPADYGRDSKTTLYICDFRRSVRAAQSSFVFASLDEIIQCLQNLRYFDSNIFKALYETLGTIPKLTVSDADDPDMEVTKRIGAFNVVEVKERTSINSLLYLLRYSRYRVYNEADLKAEKKRGRVDLMPIMMINFDDNCSDSVIILKDAEVRVIYNRLEALKNKQSYISCQEFVKLVLACNLVNTSHVGYVLVKVFDNAFEKWTKMVDWPAVYKEHMDTVYSSQELAEASKIHEQKKKPSKPRSPKPKAPKKAAEAKADGPEVPAGLILEKLSKAFAMCYPPSQDGRRFFGRTSALCTAKPEGYPGSLIVNSKRTLGDTFFFPNVAYADKYGNRIWRHVYKAKLIKPVGCEKPCWEIQETKTSRPCEETLTTVISGDGYTIMEGRPEKAKKTSKKNKQEVKAVEPTNNPPVPKNVKIDIPDGYVVAFKSPTNRFSAPGIRNLHKLNENHPGFLVPTEVHDEGQVFFFPFVYYTNKHWYRVYKATLIKTDDGKKVWRILEKASSKECDRNPIADYISIDSDSVSIRPKK
jgi:hypothetical protein